KMALQVANESLKRAHELAILNMRMAQTQVEQLLATPLHSPTTVTSFQDGNKIEEENARLRKEIEELKKRLAEKGAEHHKTETSTYFPPQHEMKRLTQTDQPAEIQNQPNQPLQSVALDLVKSSYSFPEDDTFDSPERIEVPHSPPAEELTYTHSLIQRLRDSLQTETDVRKKEDIQWELKIVEMAQEIFLEVEDLYEVHRQSTLSLLFLKIEHDRKFQDLLPRWAMEECGGYKPLTRDEINGLAPLPNQPLWRVSWIQLHTRAITEYADAPRACRIDPTFCPVKRRHTWSRFAELQKTNPDYLNYPALPPADRYCSQKYFVSSLKQAIRMYEGVPDLACRMLVKIAHLLILCVDIFDKELPNNRPWEMMLEGNQSLAYDLNKGPNRAQIMGLYARCQFLPSHHMQTFEEIFVTGFFETGLAIFRPNARNPTLRYIAYKDAEDGDPVHQLIKQQEESQKQEQIRRASARGHLH
ncbi:hypothetical protein GOP47_0028001, partial [Adiantum capillus-veneris]